MSRASRGFSLSRLWSNHRIARKPPAKPAVFPAGCSLRAKNVSQTANIDAHRVGWKDFVHFVTLPQLPHISPHQGFGSLEVEMEGKEVGSLKKEKESWPACGLSYVVKTLYVRTSLPGPRDLFILQCIPRTLICRTCIHILASHKVAQQTSPFPQIYMQALCMYVDR